MMSSSISKKLLILSSDFISIKEISDSLFVYIILFSSIKMFKCLKNFEWD